MAENPSIIRLVTSLFGTSEYLSKVFVGHPELLDMLVEAGRARPTMSEAALADALDARTAGIDADDEEARWNALAEFKHSQVLRIGLADVGGELDPDQVCRELTRVADLCLARAYDLVQAAVRARHGIARDRDGAVATMAIMALGKLGGRELGYASDLDVLFVYSADGTSDGPRPLDNVTYMSRIAQRLMRGLHTLHPSGRLYEVDTRLRPSGASGLLVSSMAAWDRYHQGEARLWERQALTKIRPVAGDRALGDRVAGRAFDYVYGHAPGEADRATRAEIAAAVTSMRDKIERELAGAIPEFDLKAGRGGLIDIEFASQYLQLAWGHAHPALRTGSTVEALAAAARLGVADADDCTLLIDGYRFLRRIEHRMRIVHDRSVHRLPDDPVELDKLALRLGYPDGASLKDAYSRWTSEVRRTYARLLGIGE
jgi:glutamate-ammonia-ligase adenylyltransferase